MPITICNDGELMALLRIRDYFNTSGALYCRLFQNDITPDEDSELGDFVEADFDGYAQIIMNLWQGVALDGTDRAFTYHGTTSFLQTGTGTTNDIYGFYLADVTDVLLFGAMRDAAAPVAMDAIGKVYNVTVNSLHLRNDA
jgi:hypothetical protein